MYCHLRGLSEHFAAVCGLAMAACCSRALGFTFRFADTWCARRLLLCAEQLLNHHAGPHGEQDLCAIVVALDTVSGGRLQRPTVLPDSGTQIRRLACERTDLLLQR
jgi:hypothetical protein